MQKTVVAIDLDEVLCNMLPSLCNWYNEKYNTNFIVSQYYNNTYDTLWGITKREMENVVDEFTATQIFSNLPPIDGSIDIVNKLCKSDKYELHIITSRSDKIKDITEIWVKNYFRDIFKEIHFCNIYSSTGKKIQKHEICSKINAKYLIDDTFCHLFSTVNNTKVIGIYFGKISEEERIRILNEFESIIPMENWTSIEKYLS